MDDGPPPDGGGPRPVAEGTPTQKFAGSGPEPRLPGPVVSAGSAPPLPDALLGLRLADLDLKPPLTVAADLPLAQAAARMHAARLASCLVEHAGGWGILTERDIVRAVAEARDKATAGDLASTPLVTSAGHELLAEAFAHQHHADQIDVEHAAEGVRPVPGGGECGDGAGTGPGDAAIVGIAGEFVLPGDLRQDLLEQIARLEEELAQLFCSTWPRKVDRVATCLRG